MFNYNHLYYFYIAAKLGGITNAAKLLRISQPALSLQVRSLENQINLKLFQKRGRNLELTPDGADLYYYCEKMFHYSDILSERMNIAEHSQKSRVRIGITRNIEGPFVAEVLNA